MTAEPWRHDWVTVDHRVRLHYVTAGDGPLLLLLHGFPETWFSWRHQIPVLARHFRVVAPDQRGYNLSDKPSGVASYTIEKLTDDVRDIIRAMGEERAIVVGHDWGGAVAWEFAARFPEMCERLIAMNCPHPKILERHVFSDPRQALRSWYLFFFQLPWLPEFLLTLRAPAVFRAIFRDRSIRKEAFPDEDLDALVHAIRRPRAAGSAINWYRASVRASLRGEIRLPKITSPTLLIWGEEDFILGKELTHDLDEICAGPHEVRYVPDCGHFVQQERPEIVNAHVLDWLGVAAGEATS